MHPPRIEPYEILQSLALHPDLASFAVKDRKTGAPATLWLAEESLLLPATAPHAHLLKRYAHGMRDGYAYVVTEPVHETLRTILTREGVLSSERAIAVALGVARGLSQLLMAGIAVGRVTAADVAVGPDGTPKVIPFSLPLEGAPSDDGLLSSLGGLYCEMLTGRLPRADDPLAAASTEILRGLVTSSLARERAGRLPEPAALPAWPPAPELGTRVLSLTTIFRWSGAAAAVAVVAIVLGVQASMRPIIVTRPRATPPVAAPAPVASLPRITERVHVSERREPRAARPRAKRPMMAEVPAASRPALATSAKAPVAPRITAAPAARALVPTRTALLRGASKAPQRTATVARPAPRVVAARMRELVPPLRPIYGTGASLDRRSMPSPATRIAMAQVPSAIRPRERVLGEPPAVFREYVPRVRHARATAGDGRVPSVRLKVVLDAEGRPETALVVRSSGDPRADEAAVRAAKDMRFDPPRSRDAETSGGRGGVTYTTLAVPNADFPGLAHPVSELP